MIDKNNKVGHLRPRFFRFSLLKFLTRIFVPYQTPNIHGFPVEYLGLISRRGFYKVFFDWLLANRAHIDQERLFRRRGFLNGSNGYSNWPTMTGTKELAFNRWYRNNQRIYVGDFVNAIKPEAEGRPYMNKRVGGVPGDIIGRAPWYMGFSTIRVGRL